MKYPVPALIVEGKTVELISAAEFKERKGINISRATLSYQFKKDRLDYVDFENIKMILWNDKARDFKLDTRGRKELE